MTSLERLLIGIVVWALTVAGGVWYGHSWGWDARQAKVDSDARSEQKRLDEKRDEGFAIAAEYEAKAADWEKRYAEKDRQLRQALRQKFQCPASGELGDVVLPADVIRGLFPSSAAAQAQPAASEPDRAVP